MCGGDSEGGYNNEEWRAVWALSDLDNIYSINLILLWLINHPLLHILIDSNNYLCYVLLAKHLTKKLQKTRFKIK
ncbi:unnamed protein product [Didymodactylos carnosus]|uniref:Uncharacterized protein n=1 Tax=Didymodactylos carnosus TaxID=1234261 RepID=A0A815PA99_9BILA|nr:unnamed protein product [Didymodactylos carnosus]CAF1446661.1 unnamed protein product [Didymodactylos carnosus]CAF4027811.1 unnamed protein product [Didymodactylos carnosus]CAF4321223.1 unnamed protein product [Didymodactylos carnosus]